MNKTILLTGVFFGVLAIILGAFGAHSLKEVLSASSLDSFETAVRYQMYHSILLLIIGTWSMANKLHLKTVYYFICMGIVCFSFSIYILSFKDVMNWSPGAFGLITPFGGVMLVIGWVLLGHRIFKYFG